MHLDAGKPHAIFLDIDGTLMAPHGRMEQKEGELSSRDAEAIRRAQAAGHKVLINTGRGYSCLPRSVFSQVHMDGFVTALGSFVEVEGKTVFNRPIPRSHLENLLEYVFAHRKMCRFQGREIALCIEPDLDLSPQWTMIRSKEAFFKALGQDVVSKITVDYGLPGDYLSFLQSFLNVYTVGDGGEGCLDGCDKATGMLTALKALGIPRERSIAVGDSSNDVEVLDCAGVSVAMGNSPESLKRSCAFVTDTYENSGVGQAIEQLLL